MTSSALKFLMRDNSIKLAYVLCRSPWLIHFDKLWLAVNLVTLATFTDLHVRIVGLIIVNSGEFARMVSWLPFSLCYAVWWHAHRCFNGTCATNCCISHEGMLWMKPLWFKFLSLFIFVVLSYALSVPPALFHLLSKWFSTWMLESCSLFTEMVNYDAA